MQWIVGFYPQVTLSAASDRVTLHSEQYRQEELAAIWIAALANERLLAQAGAGRAAAFAALAR